MIRDAKKLESEAMTFLRKFKKDYDAILDDLRDELSAALKSGDVDLVNAVSKACDILGDMSAAISEVNDWNDAEGTLIWKDTRSAREKIKRMVASKRRPRGTGLRRFPSNRA